MARLNLIDFKTDLNFVDEDATPEQRLCIAVLLNAVRDIHNKTVSGITMTKALRNSYRQCAIDWVNSEATFPFSFLWCLEQIFPDTFDKLNVKAIRQSLIGKPQRYKQEPSQRNPYRLRKQFYLKQ